TAIEAPARTESHSEKVVTSGALDLHPLATARQMLNSTHASLSYSIEEQGPSGVGKVEVWMTRDEGQTWQRLCEDPGHHSPVQFDLPGEGIVGISVVVSNGRGVGGTPPAKGETPQAWVEVDTTKPQAQLKTTLLESGAGLSTVQIDWLASDKNLGE